MTDSGTIRPTGDRRYLQVNVYPGSGRWNVAVLVKESGRPHSRLIERVIDEVLDEMPLDLASACEVASHRLAALSEDLRRASVAAGGSASPGGS